MASIIRIKRSTVSGNPGTLGTGELAYSALADTGANGGDRLYIGMGIETSGNAASHIVIGGKYFTDTVSAATNLNTASTLVKRDASGNFIANSITSALVGNASTATQLQTARTIALTGDATASGSFDGSANYSQAITLATVNSNVGTFGSSVSIPVVTVNAKGLVTAVTTASITTTLQLAGMGTTTGSVALASGTLTFTGTSGITTSVTGSTITLGIDSTVTTLTGTQTLTNKTISTGSTWLGNTIAVAQGGTGTVNGSITGTGALTFTAGGTNTNINLVPSGTGMVDVGGKRVGNAADPTQASDLATKSYVDAVKTGLNVKDSARLASTVALIATYSNGTSGVGATLTNTGTLAALVLDSVPAVAGDRVLIKDQVAALQNGIYTVTNIGSGSVAWVLTRAIDFDNSIAGEVGGGDFVFVQEGTNLADNGFVVTTNGTITVGTSTIDWVQFSGAGQITSGAGLTKSGNTLDVVGTANRIAVFTDNIDIASTYVGQTSLTTLGTITTGVWNATVLTGTYGGTGVNNGTNTITLGGNFLSSGSVTHAGAFSRTFTATGATSITLPTTGTLATLAGTETLTNKTLTAPVIATIVNTGTLTLPTSTDTLVGRATTDTLTNKTITGAVISGGTITNTPVSGATGAFTTLSASGNVTLSANITGAGAATSTIDGFQIDGGTY